jgi:polyisoprenoid-binding protein YceI
VEKYPEILFKSTKFSKSGNDYVLEGDLTIKDKTNRISMKAEFGGIGKDPYGQTKAGFTITGKLNRKDFGLSWNAALESGGVLVGEEVTFNCDVQMIRQS